MSYTVMIPCHRCAKQDTCTDAKSVREGVQKIHEKTYEEGHQGGGTIVMQCLRMRNNEPGDK